MNKPTIEDQKELLSINADGYDIVKIPFSNNSYKIGWIKEYTKEKLSLLDLEAGLEVSLEDSKRNVNRRAKFLSKAASLMILNGVRILFFHQIFWRYLYYVKGYSSKQLLPLIQLGKKKAAQVESFLGSTLVSQMKITNPTLTTEEAELFQAELSSELNPHSEKNKDGL